MFGFMIIGNLSFHSPDHRVNGGRVLNKILTVFLNTLSISFGFVECEPAMFHYGISVVQA